MGETDGVSSSLLSKILKAKDSLQTVETRVIMEDGCEMIENRNINGFTIGLKPVARRSYGFVADFLPDLQMAQVNPGLYLGGQDPAHDRQLLFSFGITHVLNLATNVENHFPMNFVYLSIDIHDLPTVDILAILPRCMQFIRNALLSGGHVFCHCNAGVSRSATIVLAYIIKFEKLTLKQAIDRVKSIRQIIRPNEGFIRQLEAYERQLQVGMI